MLDTVPTSPNALETTAILGLLVTPQADWVEFVKRFVKTHSIVTARFGADAADMQIDQIGREYMEQLHARHESRQLIEAVFTDGRWVDAFNPDNDPDLA